MLRGHPVVCPAIDPPLTVVARQLVAALALCLPPPLLCEALQAAWPVRLLRVASLQAALALTDLMPV